MIVGLGSRGRIAMPTFAGEDVAKAVGEPRRAQGAAHDDSGDDALSERKRSQKRQATPNEPEGYM
jgi:hypothetical protein